MIGDVVKACSKWLGLQHGNSVDRAVFLLKGQACRDVLPNKDLPDQKCQRLGCRRCCKQCKQCKVNKSIATVFNQCPTALHFQEGAV